MFRMKKRRGKQLLALMLLAIILVALFSVESFAAAYVSNVAVTITAPVVNDYADYNPELPADALYYLDHVVWTDWTTRNYVNAGDTFFGGHEYCVNIYLTLKDGYEFVQNVTGSINGYAASVEIRNGNQIELYRYLQPDPGWQEINGSWYYYDASGKALTGWQKIARKWYCFDPSGALETGWIHYGGNYYYFRTDFKAWQSGWMNDNGNYYYFNPATGALYTGWLYYRGEYYYLDPATGAMQTGYRSNADRLPEQCRQVG